MSMELYGMKPSSPVGEYFGRNYWAWRAVATCVLALAPEEAGGGQGWFENGGYGLNAAQSLKLAEKLDELLETGAVSAYAPWLGCDIERNAERYRGAEESLQRCREYYEERGFVLESREVTVGPDLLHKEVRKFSAFCRASGGFEIW